MNDLQSGNIHLEHAINSLKRQIEIIHHNGEYLETADWEKEAGVLITCYDAEEIIKALTAQPASETSEDVIDLLMNKLTKEHSISEYVVVKRILSEYIITKRPEQGK